MSGITAILPAFNEEVSISSMVLETKRYAGRVIVIDDGSLDRTAEVAELAGAEVIRHIQNSGKIQTASTILRIYPGWSSRSCRVRLTWLTAAATSMTTGRTRLSIAAWDR